jgi:hypothetical protein
VHSGRSHRFGDLQGLDGLGGYRNRSALHAPYSSPVAAPSNPHRQCRRHHGRHRDLDKQNVRLLKRFPHYHPHAFRCNRTSLQIRVFDDPTTGSTWRRSVKDIDGDVLCVSQFTLFANTHKGNKPDFHRAKVTRFLIASRTLLMSSCASGLGTVERDVQSLPRTYG